MKTNKILFMTFLMVFFNHTEIKAQTSWNLNGNSGVSTTNFIGVNDPAISLKFRSHNLKAGELNSNFTSLGFDVGISGKSVYIGKEAGQQTSSIGNLFNTYVGDQAGVGFTPNALGEKNSFFGSTSGAKNFSGSSNVFVGSLAGYKNTSGSFNTFLGANFGVPPNDITGNLNTFVGYDSGISLINGNRNTFVGNNSGLGVVSGTGNSFLGKVTVSNSNLHNTIILADGSQNGRQRLYIHGGGVSGTDAGAGYVGIGLLNNTIPSNMLELKSAFTNNPIQSSGLRFTNLTNAVAPITNPSPLTDKGVLSVNASGDVILVKDIGGGISNSCLFQYNVPVTTGLNCNLGCSQIYDNGLSVSIGTPITNANSLLYNSTGLGNTNTSLPVTGNLRLNINGVTRGVAFLSTSDKKFKKDIKPIENALKTIEAIDGKTYLWNKEANKDMNFDDGGHSGFIAQELEKVLPHLVATGSNGDKAVNYIELLPYLVEGMKEQQKMINDQQTQIEELKGQITNNFRSQNQDLIQFENTKIISVSPNPSNDVISVSINVEKLVQTATLNVYDLNGKLLNNLIINERATNIIKTLQKDNFGKGIYIVSLTVNGKSIDSKKIIFN